MITIQGELTDLNTFIRKSANKFARNKIKQDETDRVYWECKKQKIETVDKYPVFILFKWYSKNKKMDIDNVSFGKKFILDGLVKAQIIKGDGRKFVSGFSDEFFIDQKNPRVEVLIMDGV